jgi:hypothetical protein
MHSTDRLKRTFRPFIGPIRRFLRGGLFARPGHFYSPIVDPAEVAARLGRSPLRPADALAHIDIDRQRHLAFWNEILPFFKDLPFAAQPQEGVRYYFDNDAFGVGDAVILFAMLRRFRPKRLIEVGSGYSSACSLDTSERFLGGTVQMTFIEPYPALLQRVLNAEDLARSTIIAQPIQDVDLALFDTLEDNDILFIDSTHVVKTGSDVVFELFEILPRLKPGVLVHFHDVFDGFEYPLQWILKDNRSWNELYALRAFLMYNSAFEVLFFNDFFAKSCAQEIRETFPEFLANGGGSLWLRKTR